MSFSSDIFAEAADGAFMAGFVFGMVITIAIGALIGAIFLRGGVWLYNKFVGGPQAASAVPEPSFGKAFLITLVSMVAQAAIGVVLGLILQDKAMINKISWPITLVVNAGLLAGMLPTTFARGILVSLCEALLLIIILGAIFLVALQVGLLGGLFKN